MCDVIRCTTQQFEASLKSRDLVMNVKSRSRTNASPAQIYNIPLPRHGKYVKISFPHKRVPWWQHPVQIVPSGPGVAESGGISSRSRKGFPKNARENTAKQIGKLKGATRNREEHPSRGEWMHENCCARGARRKYVLRLKKSANVGGRPQTSPAKLFFNS